MYFDIVNHPELQNKKTSLCRSYRVRLPEGSGLDPQCPQSNTKASLSKITLTCSLWDKSTAEVHALWPTCPPTVTGKGRGDTFCSCQSDRLGAGSDEVGTAARTNRTGFYPEIFSFDTAS